MKAPPSSAEFGKFVEFVTLLSSPKRLASNVKQFAESEASYREAKKEYDDAIQIAATIEKANAIKERSEVEYSRVKTENTALDARLASIDVEIEEKKKTYYAEANIISKELDDKAAAHLNAVTKYEAKVAKQEAAFEKREDRLNEGEKTLDREMKALEDRHERVERAFEAA